MSMTALPLAGSPNYRLGFNEPMMDIVPIESMCVISCHVKMYCVHPAALIARGCDWAVNSSPLFWSISMLGEHLCEGCCADVLII